MCALFCNLNYELPDIVLLATLARLSVSLICFIGENVFVEVKINKFLNQFLVQLKKNFSELLMVYIFG